MSYREGMQIGNAMMNFGRTMSSMQNQGNQQKRMEWAQEDRNRGEQTDKILGYLTPQVPLMDEAGNPKVDEKGNPVTAPDVIGLAQYKAEQQNNGTFSNIAFNRALALDAKRQSEDINLRRQQAQADIVKGHIAYQKARVELGKIVAKKKEDWTRKDFSYLAKALKKNPLTSYHIAKPEDEPRFDKYGNLTFAYTNEQGEKKIYKRPLTAAVDEIMSNYPEKATEQQIKAWATAPYDRRQFNIKALQNPEYRRNSNGELAAIYTLKDKNGLPITYGIKDKTDKILFFNGDYEEASDNFKQNVLTPDQAKDIPEKLGSEWKSVGRIESREQIKNLGKPTPTGEKARVDLATKQYKTALGTFKQKGDSAYNEDGTLNEEATNMNAYQHALEAYQNPKSKEEYTRAARALELFTQAVGRGKPPAGRLFPDTKITLKWFNGTFSKKADAEQAKIYNAATDEQRRQIKAFGAKAAKGKEAVGTRADGTKKGPGFLGELKRPDGKVSTELSIGVEIDGKETEIPSLVPTLTKDEIKHLLSGKKPTREIVRKASEYAKKRIKEGKSPFAQKGETVKKKPTKPIFTKREKVRFKEIAKSIATKNKDLSPAEVAGMAKEKLLEEKARSKEYWRKHGFPPRGRIKEIWNLPAKLKEKIPQGREYVRPAEVDYTKYLQ